MIRVAVVDDHPVARRGLICILSGAADIDVVAEVEDPAAVGPDVVADVLICDPFPFGEAPRLSAVRELSDRAAVLAWSASRDRGDVAAAMRAGARGYLTKDAKDHAYLSAVRCLAGGALFLPDPQTPATPHSRTGLTPWRVAADHTAARAVLSEREREALAYVGRGFTHAQTATRMGVSKATVDTYIGRIRNKLQIGNKAELALAALRYAGQPQGSTPTGKR